MRGAIREARAEKAMLMILRILEKS